jgi:5'-nucleotidase
MAARRSPPRDIACSPILGVLRPHIFFDDQGTHLRRTSMAAPSVHVPFGVVNHREAQQSSE